MLSNNICCIKPESEFLRLPHFFLFKDLFYSHLEANSILKDIQNGKKTFEAHQVEGIAKHYLMLFEVLEFLHEYTPDFFVITKLQDTEHDIVCFANEEFSKTFRLKDNPEGRDILALLTSQEKEIFRAFIAQEIDNAKKRLQKSSEKKLEISVKSDSVELPIIHFGKHPQRLFDIHIKLIGVVEKLDDEIIFDGYSIMLGRDITDIAVQQEIAMCFTNIPEILHEKFYQEAYRRRVLLEHPKTITLKNTFVCTGCSDISNSAQLRYEASLIDKKNENHTKTRELNQTIESINSFLQSAWKEAKKRMTTFHEAVFLFEETDGLDYSICFPAHDEKILSQELFSSIRREELLILAEIAKTSAQLQYPLKHIIIAHNHRVDFYFEERFENCFKPETHSVDIFIKKKRFEKALEKGTTKRITEENAVTVVVNTDEDKIFYQKLFQEFLSQGIFTRFETGEVEDIPGISESFFLRGYV